MKLILEGLDCSNCALKIENELKDSIKIKNVTFNFATQTLTFDKKNGETDIQIIEFIEGVVHKFEPHVNVVVPDDKRDTSKIDYNINLLARFLVSLILFGSTFLFNYNENIQIAVLLTSYVIIGYDIILRAVKNIFNKQLFDENFLMTIATFGAIFLGEFHEANAVMLFYQFGEYLQGLAVNKSRNSISSLMDIKPTIAHLKDNFDVKTINPDELKINDIIIVKPGEKVPVDGEVIMGESFVDTVALTGESVPRKFKTGDKILSGSINKDSLLTIRVEKRFKDSTVAKILDLVEHASAKKAPTEKFITKFSRYYTPFVVYFAISLTLVPTIIFKQPFNTWFYRSLIFLVVSCPCALVVSIPLGFFSGIGVFSKNGILVKGGNFLEALTTIDSIVFDKTGTLTEGVFEVNKYESFNGHDNNTLLEYAALAESFSNHPIGKSIVNKYVSEFNKPIDNSKISTHTEISGKGISVELDNKKLLVGNHKLMDSYNITFKEINSPATLVHVALDNKYMGYLTLSDKIKPGVKKSIDNLKNIYKKEIFMLTGDNDKIAKNVANELGIDNYYSNLLPNEKVEKINEIMKNGKTIFVGDGINDAPVLKTSDVGVAMGGLGSDAAIEASDMVLMTDEISKLEDSFIISKATKKIVFQNIVFAIGIKFIVLALGAIGYASMNLAIFADVGVALLAILNALRILRTKTNN